MNTPTATETKKIGIVILILVILLGGIILVRGKRENTAKVRVTPTVIPTSKPALDYPGTMGFEPSTLNIKKGQDATVSIFIDSTKGKMISGIDTILSFDPSRISVTKITPSSYFKNYPLQKIDNNGGTVKILAYEASNPVALSVSTPVLNLTLTALKVGQTKMEINFRKGMTNLSNLVEKDTNRSILGNTVPVEIIIE